MHERSSLYCKVQPARAFSANTRRCQRQKLGYNAGHRRRYGHWSSHSILQPGWNIIVKYLCFDLGQNVRVCSVMRLCIYKVTIFSFARGESTEWDNRTPKSALRSRSDQCRKAPSSRATPIWTSWGTAWHKCIGSHGGSDLFDITLCHPLSPARIRDCKENAMNLLKRAWDEKVRRLLEFGMSSLRLWSCSPFACQPLEACILIHIEQGGLLQSTLLRELWTLWNTPAKTCFRDNNFVCLISGFDLRIWDGHRDVV